MGVWDGLKRSCRSLGGLQRDRTVKGSRVSWEVLGGKRKIKMENIPALLKGKISGSKPIYIYTKLNTSSRPISS